MVIVRTLVLCLVATCAACSSTRLLADPQRGFATDGPRQVSLAFDRMTVEQPGPEGDRSWRVILPLRIYNGTDQTWRIHAEDFDLREAESGVELPALAARPAGTTPLAEFAPWSTGSLELPLDLRPAGDSGEALDGRRFRLRCRAEDVDGTSRLILERDLVFDEFSPLLQGLYATALGGLTLGAFLAL